MAYVPVPKDLNAVKTKVMFNLTKRQLFCFGVGALLGLPVFFLTKNHIGSSSAAMLMMLIMIPAMLMAMYEKNGRPLEKILRDMFNVMFFKPKHRPYMTNNYYALIEKQDQLDKEVKSIVSGTDKVPAKPDKRC